MVRQCWATLPTASPSALPVSTNPETRLGCWLIPPSLAGPIVGLLPGRHRALPGPFSAFARAGGRAVARWGVDRKRGAARPAGARGPRKRAALNP